MIEARLRVKIGEVEIEMTKQESAFGTVGFTVNELINTCQEAKILYDDMYTACIMEEME